MGKIKKYKNGVERFLSGEKGQRFFNFAYSIGAAVVIWGALFKILHLPGGNTLLSIGMGTEVLMFLLTAFDRPEKQYHWEDVFPVLGTHDPEDRPDFNGGTGIVIGGNGVAADTTAVQGVTEAQARNAVGLPAGIDLTPEDSRSLTESIAKMSAASDQLSRMAELTDATQQYLTQMSTISEQMQKLSETTTALNAVSETLLGSYKAITDNSTTISESSTGYVEQMEALNRNIGGLNTIYEIQLKSISSQLDSIDRVNRGLKDIRDMYEKSAAESAHYCDETEKMARYMKQLNSVYEKMIKAMTVNMYRPMAGMPGMTEDDDTQA
ncbi:MAG: gliding motility protein GldL [Bacteroidales bacterium]|nr:gliding motility protein GldL [Candidatus Sodaliphilus fimicaballi]